jgi:hypothetical protein
VIKVASETCSKVLPYIDPGVGSILLQMLIASFVGGIYVIKVQWLKIKEKWNKWFKK